MLSFRSSLVSTLLLAAASARDVPSNVRDFYNSVVGQGKCNNILADGFYSIDGDSGGRSIAKTTSNFQVLPQHC